MFRQFQKSLGDFGNEEVHSLDWRDTEFISYVVLDRNADPEGALPVKWESTRNSLPVRTRTSFNSDYNLSQKFTWDQSDIGGVLFPEAGKSRRIAIL